MLPKFEDHGRLPYYRKSLRPFRRLDIEYLRGFLSTVDLEEMAKKCRGSFDVALQVSASDSCEINRLFNSCCVTENNSPPKHLFLLKPHHINRVATSAPGCWEKSSAIRAFRCAGGTPRRTPLRPPPRCVLAGSVSRKALPTR